MREESGQGQGMGQIGKASNNSKRSEEGKLCCFCHRRAETRDHVLPRSIFDPDDPGYVITVSACRKCNKESSMDDEYFRDFLSAGGYSHTVARKIWKGKVIRSLKRRPRKRRMLVGSILPLDLRTEAGVHLGRVDALTAESDRINRVLKKIVQGMFCHFEKKTLAHVNFEIHQYWFDPLEKLRAKLPHGWDIGKGVFKFWCGFSDKDPRLSIWWVVFYEKALFIVVTEPIEGLQLSGIVPNTGA